MRRFIHFMMFAAAFLDPAFSETIRFPPPGWTVSTGGNPGVRTVEFTPDPPGGIGVFRFDKTPATWAGLMFTSGTTNLDEFAMVWEKF